MCRDCGKIKCGGCKPKCDPCCKQEDMFYCGADNPCLGLERGMKVSKAIEVLGDEVCLLKTEDCQGGSSECDCPDCSSLEVRIDVADTDGDLTTLVCVVTGGSGNYDYEWDFSQSFPNINDAYPDMELNINGNIVSGDFSQVTQGLLVKCIVKDLTTGCVADAYFNINGHIPQDDSPIGLVYQEHGTPHAGSWTNFPIDPLKEVGVGSNMYTNYNEGLYEIISDGYYTIIMEGTQTFGESLDIQIALHKNNEILLPFPYNRLKSTLPSGMSMSFPITIRADKVYLETGDKIGFCGSQYGVEFRNWDFKVYKV